MNNKIEYRIITDNNGKYYAVFKNAHEAEISEHAFHGCRLACCDDLDNAYELTSDWWCRNVMIALRLATTSVIK